MVDSPFWEELRAEICAHVRAQVRAETLMIFARVHGLTLPPEAEDRLVSRGESNLEQLIMLAFTQPDAALGALREVTASRSWGNFTPHS
ncbi:hypothetical protein MFU01_83450 [Myxococcus fulvus]|uniref:Uncharacterized protein n=2 Tax=Myxococcus fulvus TaxID=33 RepID=A0A511TJA7_MYXFU|nr:hypothetical protein [Myxococcus fulvus]GEN13308.1 hypothetical protein MFU01_83450 [Myxococcus fulvus]